MIAALALALIAGQSQPAVQDDFYMDEPAKKDEETHILEARAGAGGATIFDVPGVGMAAETGLEFKPWGPVALRLSVGSNMKIGWGTFYAAPEAVFRLRDVKSTFSPYIAVGGNLTVVNISDDALGIDRIPTWRSNQGAAAGSDGQEVFRAQDSPGGMALRASTMPQATLGVRWQAFKTYALDFGGRWTMLRFHGETYQNFSLVMALCMPST
ncbi:MAG: hypothetical protein U0229_13175 [Anaeromyxobacter sp.]